MAASKRDPNPVLIKPNTVARRFVEVWPEFYSRIGKKGGEAVKQKLG